MRLYRVESDKTFVEYQPEAFADNHREAILESWLEGNPDAIVEDGRLLLIGRQVVTNLGKSIDLLAVDRSGDVVVIELKRDETPRTTLAQALEYSAFASELDHEALSRLYRQYVSEPEAHLSEDHRAYFELGDEEAVSFNKEQRIVIVGAAISPQVRETSAYLRRKGLRVTCVEFSYFTTEAGEELMSTEIVVGLEPVTTQVTFERLEQLDDRGALPRSRRRLQPALPGSAQDGQGARLLRQLGDQGLLHGHPRRWQAGSSSSTAIRPTPWSRTTARIYTEFGMLNRKVSGGADLAAEDQGVARGDRTLAGRGKRTQGDHEQAVRGGSDRRARGADAQAHRGDPSARTCHGRCRGRGRSLKRQLHGLLLIWRPFRQVAKLPLPVERPVWAPAQGTSHSGTTVSQSDMRGSVAPGRLFVAGGARL